jgi:hypothetical protein
MLLPPPLDPASAAAAPIIAHDAPRLARRAPKTTVAFVDLETTGLDPSRHDTSSSASSASTHARWRCLELLATCDEIRVFGDLVTEGMERELREAKRLGLPAHFVREVRA